MAGAGNDIPSVSSPSSSKDLKALKGSENQPDATLQSLNDLKKEIEKINENEGNKEKAKKEVEALIDKYLKTLKENSSNNPNNPILPKIEKLKNGVDILEVIKNIDSIIQELETGASSIVPKTLEIIKGKKFENLDEKEKESIITAANILLKSDEDLSFTKNSIDDFAKNYGENEKIISFFLQIKLAEKQEKQATTEKNKEIKDEIFFLVHQAGKIEIVTEAEKEELEKNSEKKEAEKKERAETNNFPSWVSNDTVLAKKLKLSSENQENYDEKVKTAISQSSLFKVIDFFLGGILSSLAQGNSVMGRFLRSFTGIPEPEEIQSPLVMKQKGGKSMKQKYLLGKKGSKNKKEINEITQNIFRLKSRPLSQALSNSEMITQSLITGFGVGRNAITSEVEELEKSTQHEIIITPNGEKQFTRIYSFLQSPTNNFSMLTATMTANVNKLPNGVGETIANGMNQLSEISSKNGFGIEGGGNTLLNMMAPKSDKLESGIPEFSKVKSEIGFPSHLDIKTRPNGDIVINWNEKNEESPIANTSQETAQGTAEKFPVGRNANQENKLNTLGNLGDTSFKNNSLQNNL